MSTRCYDPVNGWMRNDYDGTGWHKDAGEASQKSGFTFNHDTGQFLPANAEIKTRKPNLRISQARLLARKSAIVREVAQIKEEIARADFIEWLAWKDCQNVRYLY